jgi:hypothetical protein
VRRSLITFWFILFWIIILTACGAAPATPTPPDAASIYTQAAQTLAFQLTMQAGQEAVARLTEIARYTPTPLPATPAPTALPPNPTPVPPTSTPSPTIPPDDPECNRAAVLEDLTAEPGNAFLPGVRFRKTWRIQNTGTCTWTHDYALVFFDGEPMSGPERVLIEEIVRPGELIDLSVSLIAPTVEATYAGYWMLRSASGDFFGVGDSGYESLLVEIRVRTPAETAFNFSTNYCSAQWSTAAGPIPCPGFDGNMETGFVNQYDSPVLETGLADDEPAIVTFPNRGPGGRISGRFPAFRVRQGDRLRTVIGCFFDSNTCDVVFQLNYHSDGGSLKNLDTWSEVYDGHITRVDIDLSPLAGRSVEFVLTVLNNGETAEDWAFWLMPVVVR